MFLKALEVLNFFSDVLDLWVEATNILGQTNVFRKQMCPGNNFTWQWKKLGNNNPPKNRNKPADKKRFSMYRYIFRALIQGRTNPFDYIHINQFISTLNWFYFLPSRGFYLIHKPVSFRPDPNYFSFNTFTLSRIVSVVIFLYLR